MSYTEMFEIYRSKCHENNQKPSLKGYIQWMRDRDISIKGHETKRQQQIQTQTEMEIPTI